MSKFDRVFFRFKAADGTDSSLIIGGIIGFGQTSPFNPQPAGFKAEITFSANGAIHYFASSETSHELEMRLTEQIVSIWDRDKKEVTADV